MDEADTVTVVTWLSGSLRQRRTGVGWASLPDAATGAATPTLMLEEVDAAFESISRLAGEGSQSARRAALLDLWGRATEGEQAFLRGLLFEDLRQGALDGVMVDAVAQAFGLPTAAVRRASMLLGSTAAATQLARSGGLSALEAVTLQVGQPVRPMLASSAPDIATALAKVAPSGEPVVIDRKLDGIRVQIHRDGEDVRVFTRSLDDVTARLPEVVAVARQIRASRMVLDGEAIVLRSDGHPAPFQVTGSRTASANTEALRASAPLSTFLFDLLHLDGTDYLVRPLVDRVAALRAVAPAAVIVPSSATADPNDAQAFFEDSVRHGHEGVVVKAATASYDAGRRGAAWVKVKPRHTLDLMVLAAEWGHGRRQGWLSNLHLGARSGDEFVMLGKTFKGLTDALLSWQTEQLLARETRRTRSTVFVRPELVVEIAFDGLQRSSRYPGGVALRFARVLRYRDDKTADETDRLDTVLSTQADGSANDPAGD